MILPGKKRNNKEQHPYEREIRDKERKRTVGPALATINTVSPLGTALTVPRSHPVTGMMSRMRAAFPLCEVLFCKEKWEKMSSVFVTSVKILHFSLCYALKRAFKRKDDSQSKRTHILLLVENCLLRALRENFQPIFVTSIYNSVLHFSLRAIVY